MSLALISLNLNTFRQRVRQLTMGLLCVDDEHSNRDEHLEQTGEYMARWGGYVAVHPLTKNSF